MVIILFLYIGLILVMLFASSTQYIKQKQGKYFLIASVIFISLLAAFIVPKADYDLSRHYSELRIIKNSNMSFLDFVFNSSKISDANYRYAYTFNVIRFFISKYLLKEVLPFISIFFCYSILGYIILDIKKRADFSNGYIGMSLLISSGFLPILYVYSGIRNEIAMAIMALVIYLKIYKKLNLISFVILTIIAATIHPLALVVVPFVFLVKFRPGKLGIVLIILIPTALYPLMEKFRFSKNGFLKYLGAKFYNYTFVHTHSQGRTFHYAAILLTLMVLVLTMIKIQQDKIEDQLFVNFLSWYCIFTLANIKSYQISMRLPYLFGILAPIIVYTLIKYSHYNGWKKIFQYGSVYGSILVGLFTVYQNFMWMI